MDWYEGEEELFMINRARRKTIRDIKNKEHVSRDLTAVDEKSTKAKSLTKTSK